MGIGRDQDIRKGIEMLEFDISNPKSMNSLGQLYLDGQYIKKDILQAKKYVELGVARNDTESWYLMALLFEEGM